MKKMILFVGALFLLPGMLWAGPKSSLTEQKGSLERNHNGDEISAVGKRSRAEMFGYEENGTSRRGVRFLTPDGKEKLRLLERGKTEKINGRWISESISIGDISEDGGPVLVETRKSEYDFDPKHERDSAVPGEYWDETLEVMSAEGDVLAKKTFRTYPGVDLLTTTYWEARTSKDGKRFFVYYRDEAGRGNVEVYSVTGEKLAHGQAPGEIEKIDSSIDGSLVAGYTRIKTEISDDYVQHIFFLDAISGQVKILKSAGTMGESSWGASFMFFSPAASVPSGKVWVAVKVKKEYKSKKTGWSGYLSFGEVPEDLALLLKKGTKK